MSKKPTLIAVALLAIALSALAATGCGDDESEAQSTDGAFITGMIPHHESAIEMAEIAERKAEHPEIKRLATEIIAAQEGEIEDLNAIYERIFDAPASDADHGGLGLDEHMMGMSMMSMGSLKEKKPFDRAFIDQMIPHHQGAIRMSRVVLANGQDPELMDLAESIISEQSREIEQMNEWREQWYGEPSPAGGMPPMMDGGQMPSHDDMGH
jgi:uncharacterized protein (DUF305 family)